MKVDIPDPIERELTVYVCPECGSRFMERCEYEEHYPNCCIDALRGRYVRWNDESGCEWVGRVTDTTPEYIDMDTGTREWAMITVACFPVEVSECLPTRIGGFFEDIEPEMVEEVSEQYVRDAIGRIAEAVRNLLEGVIMEADP